MKRLFITCLLASPALVATGCPMYDDTGCESELDCGPGYDCHVPSGACVRERPDSNVTRCRDDDDCDDGEVCDRYGRCAADGPGGEGGSGRGGAPASAGAAGDASAGDAGAGASSGAGGEAGTASEGGASGRANTPSEGGAAGLGSGASAGGASDGGAGG